MTERDLKDVPPKSDDVVDRLESIADRLDHVAKQLELRLNAFKAFVSSEDSE